MVWMLVLYLIGGYLRHYGLPMWKHPNRYLLGYFLFALLHLLFKIAVEFLGVKLFGTASHGDLLLTYPSPLIVGEAVCLFMCFKDALKGLKPDGAIAQIIGFVTPGVFSVYLIHVHPLVFWGVIVDGFTAWGNWPLLQIIGAVFAAAVAVFIVCIALDSLRQRIFKLFRIEHLLDILSDKVENSIRKLLRG